MICNLKPRNRLCGRPDFTFGSAAIKLSQVLRSQRLSPSFADIGDQFPHVGRGLTIKLTGDNGAQRNCHPVQRLASW